MRITFPEGGEIEVDYAFLRTIDFISQTKHFASLFPQFRTPKDNILDLIGKRYHLSDRDSAYVYDAIILAKGRIQ
jgi:hypothetical protein